MKKMKPTSTQPCSYCKARAVWRTQSLNFQQKFACDIHKKTLEAYEKDNRDDGYMSEGDYQSWGRL